MFRNLSNFEQSPKCATVVISWQIMIMKERCIPRSWCSSGGAAVYLYTGTGCSSRLVTAIRTVTTESVSEAFVSLALQHIRADQIC